MVVRTNRVITQIQVAGGNLFRIAAQYLGDATQWNRIAALNGLLDPQLTGNVMLLMPPANKNAGDGGLLIPNPGTPPVQIAGQIMWEPSPPPSLPTPPTEEAAAATLQTSPSSSSVAGELLLEDGNHILTESGDDIDL